MRLILALLLVLSQQTHSATLTFSQSTATCIGGAANDEHLQPPEIVCTQQLSSWRCQSTPLRDAFLAIHHVAVQCSDECTLQYHLDFTPLAVFVIALLTTLLAGVFLAIAMYVAVTRITGSYCQPDMESCRDYLRRPGYGSFGGRLYSLGHLTDSLKNLLEYDVEDCDLPNRSSEEQSRQEGNNNLDWVTERIYLG